MNTRTLVGLAVVLVATAIPAIGSAQITHRVYGHNYGGVHQGPFGPSYIPGASSRYFGTGIPLRRGGATITYGPGGGYYGSYPTYYGYAPYGYSGYSYYPTTRYHGYRPRHRYYRRYR